LKDQCPGFDVAYVSREQPSFLGHTAERVQKCALRNHSCYFVFFNCPSSFHKIIFKKKKHFLETISKVYVMGFPPVKFELKKGEADEILNTSRVFEKQTPRVQKFRGEVSEEGPVL
jgi:hypothetical protein